MGLWFFLGPLWARVRRGSEWLALVAVVGGVVVGAVLLFSAGVSLVAWVAADYEDADAARFLMVAGWETAGWRSRRPWSWWAPRRSRACGMGCSGRDQYFGGIYAFLLLLG